MASGQIQSRLGRDEFAFYFDSKAGVEASELGVFLQRAATVARREGAELRVTATVPGSLGVIIKAIKKSVKKEFKDTPVKTTAAGTAFVGAVVAAIAHAMSPDSGQATPLAKAGAEVVEQKNVEQIQIITINQRIVVMDRKRAREIRRIADRANPQERLPAPDVRMLIGQARQGSLSGGVLDVSGELHFRPDGYSYLVPIEFGSLEASESIFAEAHFRVTGEILTRHGQPDRIVIYKADII